MRQFLVSPLGFFLSMRKISQLVDETKKSAAKIRVKDGATVHAPGNAISAIADSV